MRHFGHEVETAARDLSGDMFRLILFGKFESLYRFKTTEVFFETFFPLYKTLDRDNRCLILDKFLCAGMGELVRTLRECGKDINCVCVSSAFGAHESYLHSPPLTALNLFFSSIGLEVSLPLFTWRPQRYWEVLSRKQKCNDSVPIESLQVLAPSYRGSVLDRGALTEHESSLLGALVSRSKNIPCGNPFDHMVKILCYHSIIKCKYAVFPTDSAQPTSQAFEVYVKILARNVLGSTFVLPLISAQLAHLAAASSKKHKIVVCAECGYCLNFGRGKFKTLNFKPANFFYCRDQKEKQFTICASTGRIYCSYCGAATLRVLPMVYSLGDGTYIRAVTANNAAVVASSSAQTLDVIVPCLATPSCSSGVLKRRISITDLLYLTSRKDQLDCGKCLNDGER